MTHSLVSLILRPLPTMDFFSLPHQKQPTATEDEDGPTDLFATAFDDRFSDQSHHLPASSPYAALFTTVSPVGLPEILPDPHTLILDIRPLPAHLTSRIPNAVPISVPSTLLKHPLFSTLTLANILPTRAARRKFSQWRLARRILVHDADSAILPDGSNVLGLLRKFRAEGCLVADAQPSGGQPTSPGESQLCWLKGGFQAVLREQPSLLDPSPVTDDDDDDDDDDDGDDDAPITTIIHRSELSRQL